MEKSAIELAATEDLVTELQKRMNFRGVVIWQPHYNGVPDIGWKWHSMHCVALTVCQEISAALTPPEITVGAGEPAVENDEQPASDQAA